MNVVEEFKLYENHPDYKVLDTWSGCIHLIDEIIELIQSPSLDELSDCCYAVNRLFGSLFNMKYLRIIPFDKIHIEKCNKRYLEYGHFRSKKHLV